MVAVALVCGPLAFSPAQAAAVEVSGRVTDAAGSPIDEVLVVVYTVDGDGDYAPNYDLSVLGDESGRYTLDLAPGTYKLEFVGDYDVHVPEFYDDADDIDSATVVTVDDESAELAAVELASWPTVKGWVKAVNGAPITDGFVRAYTRDETGAWEPYYDTEINAAGGYSLAVDAGTYRIGFFADSDQYRDEYWDDASAIDQAKDVTVGEEGAVGISAVLARVPMWPLANWGRPTVDGSAAVGQTLRGGDGRWSAAPETTSRQWLRNGTAIPGATGSEYRVTAADVGAKLSSQVTAAADGYHPASAVSRPTTPVGWTSKIAARSKAGKKKATLKIVVTSGGGTPTGTVTVKLRNKKIKTVRLKSGKATITIKKLTRKHRYTVVYNPDALMFGAQTSVWGKPKK
jgi:hypothetical protein